MKHLAVLFLSVLILSCSKSTSEDPDPVRLGYDFMPLDIGKSWTYKLDSIVYDPEPSGIRIDTLSSQVKLVAADTFRNGADKLVYRIDRFTREDDTSAWNISDVWSFYRDESQFVWTEENVPFIKLVFPVSKGEVWDGNAMIDEDNTRAVVRGEELDIFKFWNNYQVTGFSEAFNILGEDFTDVLTVDQVDREILIEKRYSIERYARGVGLIFKRLEILDTQNTDTSMSFYERAERGFILQMQILDYQ